MQVLWLLDGKFNHGHFQVPRNIQNIELLIRRILKVNTGLLRTDQILATLAA
jgi:hypothetical protein